MTDADENRQAERGEGLIGGARSSFVAAAGLFTIIPMPATAIDRGVASRAILALPWAGLALGMVSAVVAGVVQAAGAGSLLAAVLGVGVVVLATGAMHFDGLADTVDGLASRQPREAALAIMKKSDVGAVGVAAVVLVALAEVAALASPKLGAAGDWALPMALAVGAMVGRFSAVAGTAGSPPAHAGGFAALFAGVTTPRALAVDGAACLAVALVGGALASGVVGALVFGVASLVAWALGWAWRARLERQFGGLTGDMWGALIEVTQLAFWIVLAVAL